MSLQVRQESFESLSDEWRALALASPTASVFATPAWQQAWWECRSNAEELLLLAFREGGEATAIAPLMRAGDTIQFIAYPDVCDYHEFLVVPGVEEEFYTRLLDELLGMDWSILELNGLSEDSLTLRRLPALAQRRGLAVEQGLEEVSPRVPVPPTWEDYLNLLGKKDRHELRRKLRRLNGAGSIACYGATDPQRLAEDVAAMLHLLRSSGEAKAAFLTPQRERFFHNLAEAMSDEGYLKLFFLELDGVRVAASFCLDYKGVYYLYNSGYNTQFASLSVGLLLKALCLKDAIERGRTCFDLLRGPEGYKYDLGGRDHGLHKVVIRR